MAGRKDDPRAEHLKRFVEDLHSPNHALKTRKDVQNFLEKVVNGIMMGVVPKEQSAPLGVFIPLAYKIAKENETLSPGTGGLSVTFKQTEQMVTLQMSEAEMDAYLTGNDQVRVEVIEKMEAEGKISIGKKGEIKSEVKPEKIKTDLKTIAAMSNKTELPITEEQAKTLFGKNLNDKHHITQEPGPDMTGFGALFEEKNMRKIAPKGALHQWKGKYETTGGPFGQLWFTCQVCGKRQPNVDKEFCEGTNED